MIKKHSKITVIIVAILMFTSTWAGVFAADTEAQQNTEVDTPAAAEPTTEGTDSEGIDGGVVSTDQDVEVVEGTEDPEAVTEESTEAENLEDAVSAKAEKWAPTATADKATVGATITVKWVEPTLTEGQTIAGYSVVENVNGTDGAPVDKEATEELTAQFTNKTAGVYKYKVIAKVTDENAGESTEKPSEYSNTVRVVAKPNAPTQYKALSGCKCIVISFDKGTADGFLIYRYKNATDFNNYKNHDKRIDPVSGKNYIKTVGTKATWTNSIGVTLTQNYWYRIYAVNKINPSGDFRDSNVIKSNPVVIPNKGCVRPMYITLKLKKKRTLKSLNGGPRITLKKNTTITANGFGGGCYYFTYKGKKYRMARTSAKKQKALYNGRKGYNYSREEAELFVKQAGLKSKTNYLIWVSFYTQRLYLMKKTNGTWKCINDWDCATGKAATPSPTGHKAIGKKKPSHHGIKWWCSFSNPKSIANSLHGKRKGWKLGLPQSHGCIRNEVANAKWIYKNCPKKTMVYNY